MTTNETADSGPWLDRLFEAYYMRRPVNATFVGARGHDHRLPDVSPEGVAGTASEMETLLAEAPVGMPTHPIRDLAQLDRRIAEGFLRIQLWEHESGWQLGNPSAHTGEAVFGLMSLLLPGSAPVEGQADALIGRMEGLDAFFTDSRAHLREAPTSWTERALRECRGGLAFLRDGLPRAEVSGAGSEAFRAAVTGATEAFERYSGFLESELMHKPSDRIACGADAFDLHLREGHFLDRGADEIAAYAREEIASAKAWLAEAAAEHGGATPTDVLARLADAHPSADGYVARYEEVWQEMREVSDQRDLVSWPDFPIRYAPRPIWSREAAPDLYFLFYRSPTAFGRPPVHDYMIAPLEAGMSSAEQDSFLRSNNDSVIKLNHVVHHGGIGHHVQNWNAFRSPLRIGRMAAVDCSSRIAMFCGGTMAEGWACYATDLMAEAGGLTPLEVFAEHSGRVRMAARAVVDVELHHGRMTLDEAAHYYVDTAGMSEAAGRAEAVKNSMFPGAALMYLVGTDMIHELRADLMRILGDRFVLRDFHDAFLSYGSIPVKIVADEMRSRATLGLPLNAHAPLGAP
jgi:hypothetical protein